MHLLLLLSSVLLTAFAAHVLLRLQARARGWERRRATQLAALLMPALGLGVGLAGLYHFASQVCFLGAPPWEVTTGGTLAFLMTGIALGALGLGVFRLLLMNRSIGHKGEPAGPELQGLADGLAWRLGAGPPRILVCDYARPFALTIGLFRPAVLLSTGLVKRLKRAELEAVLAHEMAHVARRDYLFTWVGATLRDAFFYLPTSRKAFRQVQQDKEAASDDVARWLTDRPLALASALVKVWQPDAAAVAVPAQPLTEGNEAVEARVHRLLDGPEPAEPEPAGKATLGLAASGTAGLLAVQALGWAALLVPMGCGAILPLG